MSSLQQYLNKNKMISLTDTQLNIARGLAEKLYNEELDDLPYFMLNSIIIDVLDGVY